MNQIKSGECQKIQTDLTSFESKGKITGEFLKIIQEKMEKKKGDASSKSKERKKGKDKSSKSRERVGDVSPFSSGGGDRSVDDQSNGEHSRKSNRSNSS